MSYTRSEVERVIMKKGLNGAIDFLKNVISESEIVDIYLHIKRPNPNYTRP